MKFVPAYHFCLNLPATFPQPRTSINFGPISVCHATRQKNIIVMRSSKKKSKWFGEKFVPALALFALNREILQNHVTPFGRSLTKFNELTKIRAITMQGDNCWEKTFHLKGAQSILVGGESPSGYSKRVFIHSEASGTRLNRCQQRDQVGTRTINSRLSCTRMNIKCIQTKLHRKSFSAVNSESKVPLPSKQAAPLKTQYG